MILSRRASRRARTVAILAVAAGLAGHVATDPYVESKLRAFLRGLVVGLEPNVVLHPTSTFRTDR